MILHFITRLQHSESEGNQSALFQSQSEYRLFDAGIKQAQCLALLWKLPFHSGNTGYAQLPCNSSPPQWAVISLYSHYPPLQAHRMNSWMQN